MAIISSIKQHLANITILRKGPKALKPQTFRYVASDDQPSLSNQGWTTVALPPDAELLQSLKDLLLASQEFFAKDREYKRTFYNPKEGSEEGWSCVEGEKELITLRTLPNVPPEMQEAAKSAWAQSSKLLNEMLGQVANSLGLDASALQKFSIPCGELCEEKTATMLRLFRYEGDVPNKIVAEPHCDLGLLTLVLGDTPGLEVWNAGNQQFQLIESEYLDYKQSASWDGNERATILSGRHLQAFSNGRYGAGGHRVRSYPNTNRNGILKDGQSNPPKYRYSLVFVLRAHSPVLANSNELTTEITGVHQNPFVNITAGEMFNKIHRAHFNINTNVDERNKQRENLRKIKENEAS